MRPTTAEPSHVVAARVARARARQKRRFHALKLENIRTNGRCPASVIEKIAALDAASQSLLREAAEKKRLSARAYHRVLKVALTLADLDQSDKIRRAHLAEAISYRHGAEALSLVS